MTPLKRISRKYPQNRIGCFKQQLRTWNTWFELGKPFGFLIWVSNQTVDHWNDIYKNVQLICSIAFYVFQLLKFGILLIVLGPILKLWGTTLLSFLLGFGRNVFFWGPNICLISISYFKNFKISYLLNYWIFFSLFLKLWYDISLSHKLL